MYARNFCVIAFYMSNCNSVILWFQICDSFHAFLTRNTAKQTHSTFSNRTSIRDIYLYYIIQCKCPILRCIITNVWSSAEFETFTLCKGNIICSAGCKYYRILRLVLSYKRWNDIVDPPLFPTTSYLCMHHSEYDVREYHTTFLPL